MDERRQDQRGANDPAAPDRDATTGADPDRDRMPGAGSDGADPERTEATGSAPARVGASGAGPSAAPADRDAAATTDQLRSDIDSGRTHDKVAKSDPAAAPLGSDAEAGGNPPAAREVATARKHETGRKVAEKTSAAKPSQSRVATQTTDRSGWWFAAVVAAIILVAIILAFIF